MYLYLTFFIYFLMTKETTVEKSDISKKIILKEPAMFKYGKRTSIIEDIGLNIMMISVRSSIIRRDVEKYYKDRPYCDINNKLLHKTKKEEAFELFKECFNKTFDLLNNMDMFSEDFKNIPLLDQNFMNISYYFGCVMLRYMIDEVFLYCDDLSFISNKMEEINEGHIFLKSMLNYHLSKTSSISSPDDILRQLRRIGINYCVFENIAHGLTDTYYKIKDGEQEKSGLMSKMSQSVFECHIYQRYRYTSDVTDRFDDDAKNFTKTLVNIIEATRMLPYDSTIDREMKLLGGIAQYLLETFYYVEVRIGKNTTKENVIQSLNTEIKYSNEKLFKTYFPYIFSPNIVVNIRQNAKLRGIANDLFSLEKYFELDECREFGFCESDDKDDLSLSLNTKVVMFNIIKIIYDHFKNVANGIVIKQ